MTNGEMGKPLHPKIAQRVRELLRKPGLTAGMIAQRVGISESQVRNLKKGVVPTSNAKRQPRHQMQDEFKAIFGDDAIYLPHVPTPLPVVATKPSRINGTELDLFDIPVEPKNQKFTPELERKLIVSLRGKMPMAMIANKFNVSVADVETLSERVFWLSDLDDANTLMPCRLSAPEYLRTVGPRFTRAQVKKLKPYIDSVESMLMGLLEVDQRTAETIRKIVWMHHFETGWKPKPIVKPVYVLPTESIAKTLDVRTATAKGSFELSDELEPLSAICLRSIGREPEDHIRDAWLMGRNDLGIKLETFEVDGQLMTTEKHFSEFFRTFVA